MNEEDLNYIIQERHSIAAFKRYHKHLCLIKGIELEKVEEK